MMTESLDCGLATETNRNQSRSLSLKTEDQGRTTIHRVGEWLVQVTDSLLSWQYRAHERAHLMTLDDRMLRDIGLARADVENEAAKPFWRP